MTSRAKRLMLMVGIVALIAAIAGAVMAPGTAAAPKKDHPGKGKPPRTGPFWIYTDQYLDDFGYMYGYFYAGGAIEDWGTAYERYGWPDPIVCFNGATGFMRIKVTGDTFEVVYAVGDYSHLLGATGTCSAEWVMLVWKKKEQFPVAVHRTFEGTVPE